MENGKLLWDAVYAKDYTKVLILLKEKDIIRSLNTTHGLWENTSLHCAAKNGNLKIVRSILLYKPNIDAINMNGSTPLHLAIEEKHKDIVKELILAGANPNKRNYTEKSAIELAKLHDTNDILSIILNTIKSKTVHIIE